MKKEVFCEVLGNINEIYVKEARETKSAGRAAGKSAVWVKWGALASCLCLVVCLYIPFARLTARFKADTLPTDYIQKIVYNNAYYEVCDDNDKSVLKKLGIKENITSADAGEFVTYLKKKTPGGKSEYIASEDISDIVLYSYAEAPCEAVYVICDNGQYDAVVFCRILDNEAVSLEKAYAIYNIKGASDISSISVVDSWSNKKIVGPTLTDETVISQFYSLSLALKDFSHRDHHKMNYGHIVTEEELVQAYAKTAESELTIMIETVDGLRFCLEYDPEGGWIESSQTMRYYRVTEEMASWFSNNF